jgi:hypothetical protein
MPYINGKATETTAYPRRLPSSLEAWLRWQRWIFYLKYLSKNRFENRDLG